MSTEENKAVFRRWARAWEQGDFAAIDELVAPDYVSHLPGRPDTHGPAGDKQHAAGVLGRSTCQSRDRR